MRDIEKLLVALNVAGALIQGWRHDVAWLIVPLAAFSAYVVLQDRALRRQIGPRAWPSEGFARFTFNTNLYFSVCQVALSIALFVLAGMAASLVGG